MTCLGRIRTPDEYTLSIQNLINEENVKSSDFEIEIEAKDIYKDLHIMGYDYGPKFQCLKAIKTNNFERLDGTIQWEGNWVTFMDSLLQTMAAAMPFRKMMVPVMIKQLRCDPKVFYEAIAANRVAEDKAEVNEEDTLIELCDTKPEGKDEVDNILGANNIENLEDLIADDFHIYKSLLPFHVDMNSRMIVAPGVEIEDLMALPIPRKTNVQDLKVESYQFVANEDNNAIEECYKKSIKEYVKV